MTRVAGIVFSLIRSPPTDVVLGDGGDVRVDVAPGQDAAVNHRVQGLDAAVEQGHNTERLKWS